MMRVLRANVALAVVLCCLASSGCGGSKINKENFDKITNDMSLKEVENILGTGTPQGGGGSIAGGAAGVDVGGGLGGAKQSSTVEYKWESGDKWITVGFRQDKVVGKSKRGI